MTRPAPPVARRKPRVIEQLGRRREDAYHWLKDANWQKVMRDPSQLRADIRAYLDAENAYSKAHLEEPLARLCETLIAEMRGRIREDDASVPAPDGPFAYATRYRPGGEYPCLVRFDREHAFSPDAAETMLYDGDLESEGRPYFDIGALAHSPDHQWLAYALDTQGSEYYTLRLRHALTGEDRALGIDRATGSFAWSANSDAIYWVERNEKGRSCAVFRRRLGAGEDELVYRETDEGFFVSVSESQSGDVIFISSHDHATSECRWLDARDPEAEARLIARRQTGHEYSVDHGDGRFFILTNHGGATDFRIAAAPMEPSDPAVWEDVVPHSAGTYILDLVCLKRHLVRLERRDGVPRIIVRRLADGSEHEIAFTEAAYSLGIEDMLEHDTDVLRFGYASPTTPDQVFDYDMETRKRTLRQTREVPSGHDPADYVAERLFAKAEDGAEIPVTLLRRTTTPVNGSAPLLLYGYGAYGITIPAGFSTGRLSLVDRGMTYAIAHVRGGAAKGYQWYLDGKLDRKANSFTDYLAVARHLAATGHTSEGRIVALGGSAGGLLVGAAANLAPDLFAGIIAAVPFVDVLNTMSDASLPLTPPEWPEWGNPLADEDAYDRIAAFAPYEQVSARPYPPMLVTGGLSDSRVTYWEPAKWVARLRHEAPDAGPYYLRINMDAGHGGATGRFEGLKETALEYAFALHVTGLAGGS